MNDKPKIILGLLVLVAAVTFPIWRGFVEAGPPPEPVLPDESIHGKFCVESREYMAANHMNLLDTWRDEVVRQGKKTYVSKMNGAEHEMSLTRTCMSCHTSKKDFCDRCHNYADVKPYCWDCHVETKGGN